MSNSNIISDNPVSDHYARPDVSYSQLTLMAFLAELSYRRYYVEKGFQRNLVWTTKEMDKFIENLFNKKATGVHVVGCLESSELASEYALHELRNNRNPKNPGEPWTGTKEELKQEIRKHEHSLKKVQELLRARFKYVSIDGMQRRQCLMRFFKKPQGKTKYSAARSFMTPCGTTYQNKRFDEISQAHQNEANNMQFLLQVQKNTPYHEFPSIFIDINSCGLPLNRQETRNAIQTEITDLIDRTTESVKGLEKAIPGKSQQKRQRMDPQEYISKLVVSTSPGGANKTCDDDTLDDFYRAGEHKNFRSVTVYDNVRRDLGIIEYIYNNIIEKALETRSSKTVAEIHFWHLYFAQHWLMTKRKSIVKGREKDWYSLIQVYYQAEKDNSEKALNKLLDKTKVDANGDREMKPNTNPLRPWTKEEIISKDLGGKNNWYHFSFQRPSMAAARATLKKYFINKLESELKDLEDKKIIK